MSQTAVGTERLLTGWGRTAPTRAEVLPATGVADVEAALASAGPRGVLARGLGRSYGDVAQNAGGRVLDLTPMDGVRAFDAGRGLLIAGAGATLDRLLPGLLAAGWFPPVTPGTRFVTLGGVLANDVHGKNHHADGSIADHVVSFELLSPAEGSRTIAPASDAETFWATAGGLGLTGVMTEVTLKLLRVETSRVVVDTERAGDIDDLMARMEDGDHRYRYSVAWIDCLASGGSLGRSVLTRADHAALEILPQKDRDRPLDYHLRSLPEVPAAVPRLVGRATARAFNELWFRKAPREERGRIMPLAPFFYPLDAPGGWNRLYGRRGFVQHQLVLPFGEETVLRRALELLSGSGSASFLAVVKRFGPGHGFLSFPMPGWTLALDLPTGGRGLGRLLDTLDHMVAGAGGRVYLAKDSRLSPDLLGAMYPELDRWREVRERLDPDHVLRSDLDRRLGLTDSKRKAVVA